MIRPPLVERAARLADLLGFTRSCLDEVGALLHVLAGAVSSGRMADIGTGCGVSAAWMASATSLDIFTVDNNPNRADAIRDLFADCAHVYPLVGGWEDILPVGPFRFIFVDAKSAKETGLDRLIEVTEVGGLLVVDDLTPVEFWPDEWHGRPDPVREIWLNHPQLASTEIRTSSHVSAVLARPHGLTRGRSDPVLTGARGP